MNAPGKGLLMTISILFIIFGAIAAIISLLGMLGSAALSAYGGVIGTTIGGVMLFGLIVMLIVSVAELIIGILGVRRSDDPSRANFFIATGIVLAILALVPLIISATAGAFQWMSLIGFVLPILYIVGGAMNRKVVAR